jgi:uncharacterized protein with ATP-grasp and redox domains
MRAKPECITCIIDDLCGAAQLLDLEETAQFQVIKESLRFLTTSFDGQKVPSHYITEVHRILKRVAGIEVPFEVKRERCNEIGLKLSQEIEEMAEGKNEFEKFSFLVHWAIAGNGLDFRTVGTGYDFQISRLKAMLTSYMGELKVNHLPKLYTKVKQASKVLYIHDNVGEIAFDKVLIKDIQGYGAKVISAVRGGPITSDATMEDAKQVGLHRVSDAVILAGPDTLGISFDEMSSELREQMQSADLVLAKGQANYYVLSEYKDQVAGDIACLFRTKCDIVSNIFGESGEIGIAVLL